MRRDGSIFGWQIFTEIKGQTRGPLNNTIDVKGKVKQKENNEIVDVLESEEEDGDLIKHEDSTKHIGGQSRMGTKVPYKRVHRHEG